jgi:hypothetical protein
MDRLSHVTLYIVATLPTVTSTPTEESNHSFTTLLRSSPVDILVLLYAIFLHLYLFLFLEQIYSKRKDYIGGYMVHLEQVKVMS